MTWLARLARHTKFSPQHLGLFSRGYDRSLNLNLYFLGNRGVINVAGVVWGPQCLSHYVAHVPGLIFSVLNATVASVYESCISKVANSTSEG